MQKAFHLLVIWRSLLVCIGTRLINGSFLTIGLRSKPKKQLTALKVRHGFRVVGLKKFSSM